MGGGAVFRFRRFAIEAFYTNTWVSWEWEMESMSAQLPLTFAPVSNAEYIVDLDLLEDDDGICQGE